MYIEVGAMSFSCLALRCETYRRKELIKLSIRYNRKNPLLNL
jgi:hypothetical protein